MVWNENGILGVLHFPSFLCAECASSAQSGKGVKSLNGTTNWFGVRDQHGADLIRKSNWNKILTVSYLPF